MVRMKMVTRTISSRDGMSKPVNPRVEKRRSNTPGRTGGGVLRAEWHLKSDACPDAWRWRQDPGRLSGRGTTLAPKTIEKRRNPMSSSPNQGHKHLFKTIYIFKFDINNLKLIF